MSKKYSLLVSIVLLLSIAAISSAVNITWSNGGADGGNWNNTANWTGGVVPDSIDDWAKIRMATGPVFSTGRTATAFRVYLEGSNGTLTMSGGTLNTVSHIYAGVVSTDTATLNMSGGDVNIVGTFYISRDAGSIATVNLSGGTITCAVLAMGSNGGTGGRIDISSTGKLIIDGNAIQTITPWINNGWIKAYNGAGAVMKDYNVTTPLKTTVWATISEKATIPNPISDANNVPVSGTNLSWKPGMFAASHDVYFGTVSNDVNTAERLLGDLNGNGIVDFKDVSRLTLYWLTNPAGSEPYAGVNDDNIVDFFDYSLFSGDWRNTAAPVFKGNQDTNSFSPGALAFAATYYWRIDEVNGPNTAKGDVWNFKTQTGKASIPAPANGEPNVLSRAVLVWTAGAGATSHDVYFGTANPPVTLVSDNQTATTYNPGAPLANSTTYYWRIDENYGTGTVQGDVWNFTTIDAANEPDIVFVQASDPQMGWSNCGGTTDYLWGVTVGKINNINPDFMLVTGDLVDSSTSDPQVATYKSYKSALNPTIECYEVPGNHDLGEPPNQDKYDRWANNYGYGTAPGAVPWYSFAYGDSFFIGLDDIVLRSPFGGQDVNEMNWLTQTLIDANEAGYAHKFVFMHVALFITSATEPNNSAENLPGPDPGSPRQTLLNLFHQYGVKVVMAGHRHTNNYAVDGDLQMYTTTSCTCGLGSPPTPPGIRIFKVYSDRVEQEQRTLDSLP